MEMESRLHVGQTRDLMLMESQAPPRLSAGGPFYFSIYMASRGKEGQGRHPCEWNNLNINGIIKILME
jgi:hypothetical protein